MAGVEHELLDFLKGTNHELVHVFSVYCSEKERRAQIAGDVQTMSQMFGQHVVGFAYPYGIGAKQSAEILHAAGVRCARTAHMEGGFRFPADPLKTNLSCWHISRKAYQRLNQFFAAEPTNDDLFFLMFAHGYEFDFGTKESNWDKFERICAAVAAHDDIVCCSIGEAFACHGKGRS